jgi:hypothetical protein
MPTDPMISPSRRTVKVHAVTSHSCLQASANVRVAFGSSSTAHASHGVSSSTDRSLRCDEALGVIGVGRLEHEPVREEGLSLAHYSAVTSIESRIRGSNDLWSAVVNSTTIV